MTAPPTDLGHRLREALRLTLEGNFAEATALIQQAMSVAASGAGPAPAVAAATPPPVWRADSAPRVLGSGLVDDRAVVGARPAGDGEFIEALHRDGPRRGSYKLFVPPGSVGRLLPLVVMLHGCMQDADDFAAGTGMNDLAREQGFFVIYPEQSRQANASRCWNWFKPTHQARGSGEPALIAGLVQAVMQRYGIDARRVYIAGLSAGGAMAAIVGAAYPELFAAVGVHSAPPTGVAQVLPTIVFHGDGDPVVPAAARLDGTVQAPAVDDGVRRVTRTHWPAAPGSAPGEHWLVHGAGHAWSGGQAAGSYTDPAGPDASREMLRFFAEHARAGAAVP